MVTGFHIGIIQNSQDAALNRSNVTVALTITWNGGSYNATGSAAGTLTVDGTDYPFTAVFNTGRQTSGSQILYSKTLEIAHDADGAKSLSCSASFATGTMAGTVTASATKTLTPIPRESTVGATDANIGATSVISVNRKNTAYTHCVAYCFGGLSGYLADGDGTLSDEEVKLTAVSLSFPIPEAFYAQIPDSRSGTCQLTVKTYAGDTQVGTEKTCTFTVTAAEEKCRPDISGTVTDINETTLALTGDENTLVRGFSTALCTVDAQSKNGASVVKKTVGDTLVEGDTLSVAGVENSRFVFTATDSRGYTGTFEKTVNMVEYRMLTCNAEAYRTDPTSGNGILNAKGNFFSGTFGARENTLQVYYQIDGGEPVQLQPQITENQYTVTAGLSGLDYRSAHTVTVTAADQLMTRTKTLTVGKGIPVFDWSEEDFVFRVPVTAANGVNGVFMGSRYVDGVNLLTVQSEKACFDGTGKGRQIFFITGCANGLPVCGTVGVWLKDGKTFISGVGIADATSDTANGQVGIVFDTTPWDTFTVISGLPFAFV